MNLDEDAAISYNPDDDAPSQQRAIHNAFQQAEQQLTKRPGVMGLGMSKLPDGSDAIVVYVADQQAMSRLPANIDGIPIIGEVTGEIRPF